MTGQKWKLEQKVKQGAMHLSPLIAVLRFRVLSLTKTASLLHFSPPFLTDFQAALLYFGSLQRRRGFERRGKDRDTDTGSMELRSEK